MAIFIMFVIRNLRFPDYLENSIGAGAGAGAGSDCDPHDALRAIPAAAAKIIAIFIMLLFGNLNEQIT